MANKIYDLQSELSLKDDQLIQEMSKSKFIADTIVMKSSKIKQLEKTISKTSAKFESERQKGSHEYEKNLLMRNRSLLSQNQLDLMSGKKKQVRWSAEDLSKGYAIKLAGGSASLSLIRDGLKLPLPSKSTLYRRSCSLNLRPG